MDASAVEQQKMKVNIINNFPKAMKVSLSVKANREY
jgi:hypothetical protein